MPLGPSGHDLWRWQKLAGWKRRPSCISAVQTGSAAPNGAHHHIPGGVSGHEKFLLAGLLLVVAGWIVFRLAMPLVALH